MTCCSQVWCYLEVCHNPQVSQGIKQAKEKKTHRFKQGLKNNFSQTVIMKIKRSMMITLMMMMMIMTMTTTRKQIRTIHYTPCTQPAREHYLRGLCRHCSTRG
jgi:hypothetical protein